MPMEQEEKPRRGYHHGNLAQALIDASAALVDERGPEGFSLLDAARACGVSASAPYKHFADKAALLDELSRRGGERLNERLGAAWADGGPSPAQAFLRLGKAYLAFAREEPGLYLALFRPGCQPATPPGMGATPLGNALSALGVGGGRGTELAMQIWAFSHGLASLERTRQLPFPADDLLDSGVARLLRGFGVESGKPVPLPPLPG